MDKVPILLGIIGMALQFVVRQRKGASDLVYVLLAAGLCTVVYGLTHWPFTGVTWNVAVIDWLIWLGQFPNGAVMTVLAGTGLVSVAANVAASKLKIDPSNPLVPVTDSK